MISKYYRSITNFGKAFLLIEAESKEDKKHIQKLLLFFDKEGNSKSLAYKIQVPHEFYPDLNDFILAERNSSDLELFYQIIEPNTFLKKKNLL